MPWIGELSEGIRTKHNIGPVLLRNADKDACRLVGNSCRGYRVHRCVRVWVVDGAMIATGADQPPFPAEAFTDLHDSMPGKQFEGTFHTCKSLQNNDKHEPLLRARHALSRMYTRRPIIAVGWLCSLDSMLPLDTFLLQKPNDGTGARETTTHFVFSEAHPSLIRQVHVSLA